MGSFGSMILQKAFVSVFIRTDEAAARRRLVFDELVGKAADRAAKEAKRAARAAEAFTALLRDTKGITQDMPWEEAHVLVAGDRDYQAVSTTHAVTPPPSPS